MKVLVTGSRGQLGRELCRQLGDDAIPLARDTLDLTRGLAIYDTITNKNPDMVINCAAYTQVDRAEIEPDVCRAVNATAVDYIADACRMLDCPLMQVSTDYVFSGEKGRNTPYKEEEPPSPRGVYATSKLEGEAAAACHAKHLIVRTCGLYANPVDENAHNFVQTMLHLGRKRQSLRVVDDQYSTPSYVPHVAKAMLFLAGYGTAAPASNATPASSGATVPWGIYHVTNTGATSWYGFAREIFRLAEMDVAVEPISTTDYSDPTPRPTYSVLDTTAYHRLGGPPMPHWKEALADYFLITISS